MKLIKKEIKKQIDKQCSVCGKAIKIIVYQDKTYRGGHYFFKIPFYKKKEMSIAMKNTRKSKVGGMVLNVIKKMPKPYKHEEYWECPKCYWRG